MFISISFALSLICSPVVGWSQPQAQGQFQGQGQVQGQGQGQRSPGFNPYPGAANPAGPGPYLNPGSVDAKTHIIKSGDVLEIDIYSIPELVRSYQVRADGRFFHPVAGEVQASGLTVDKVEANLKRVFTKQLRYPAFKLGIQAMADKQASALGEVRAQGKFSIAAGTTLLDFLAQVGGLTPKADPEGAVIMRGGKQIPVDLSKDKKDEAAKIIMQSGDILYVNPGRRIGVSGEVYEKGIYAVSSRSTKPLEDAIKLAGGAKETAALNRVLLVRPSLSKPITLDLLSKDPAKPLPALEDGDTLLIPARRALILGASDKQGQLPLTGSETLLDVVSQTGATRGQLDHVVVIRAADVAAGVEKKEEYNLQEALREGKMQAPVMIYDGDLVYVPPKPEGGGVGGALQQVMPLMNLIYLARLLF